MKRSWLVLVMAICLAFGLRAFAVDRCHGAVER